MKDSRSSRLPDTPWHVGFAKKKEDDPRRHRSRCVHYYTGSKLCGARESMYFGKTCPGSSHCAYYAETWEDAKRLKENSRTIDEEGAEEADKHRKVCIDEAKRLMHEQPLKHFNVGQILYCKVCGEDVSKQGCKKGRVECPYCHAVYEPHTASEIKKNNYQVFV